MWHPWMVGWTISEVVLLVSVGLAIRRFCKNTDKDDDVISIGLVFLVFFSVLATIAWVCAMVALYQNGVY